MNNRIIPEPGVAFHGVEMNVRQTDRVEFAAKEEAELFAPATPAVKRILLADDDLGVREMLGRVLASEGYAVLFAKTGREASARFMDEPPDLVLLDLNMPDKDGWEAFDLMCSKHPMIPVIVITARPHQYSRALELGIDALMEKPLNLPLLLESIRNLLAESDQERTNRLTDPHFRTAFLERSERRMAMGGRA